MCVTKRTLLALFGILSCIFGSELAIGAEIGCQHGCGNSSDPDVIQIGKVLVRALETIDFLEEGCSTSSSDGELSTEYEGVLGGDNWRLLYMAEYLAESDCYDDDLEENEIFEQYTFHRERSSQIGAYDDGHFGITLDNFLETNAFINCIFNDISFVAMARKRENLEKIAYYKSEITKNPHFSVYKDRLKAAQDELGKDAQEGSDHSAEMELAQGRINSMYRDIFDLCINNHQSSGSFYCRGMLNFNSGEFIDAFDDVSRYLKLVEKQEKPFPEEAYLYQGILQSEMGAYNDAIESLGAVIKHNPKNQEAYFERACAYFELGEFDLSLKDYLTMKAPLEQVDLGKINAFSFSLGLTKGIVKGGVQAGLEFVPSILSSLHGIGHGLWAFAQEPVQVSASFVSAVHSCVDFTKSHTSQEVLVELVPELKELVEQWDTLSDECRGELSGVIIGKYGVEIFACSGVAKAVKTYRELRRANRLLTFEAMTISQENANLIKLEALRRSQARKEILCRGNLKIQWDKQGKHVEGHRNFNSIHKSVFVHSDPQALVNRFSGKGIRVGNQRPGIAGYQELVNFEEFIGYAVDRETGKRVATTWGKIHYANDGVHIVPTNPRG